MREPAPMYRKERLDRLAVQHILLLCALGNQNYQINTLAIFGRELRE